MLVRVLEGGNEMVLLGHENREVWARPLVEGGHRGD